MLLAVTLVLGGGCRQEEPASPEIAEEPLQKQDAKGAQVGKETEANAKAKAKAPAKSESMAKSLSPVAPPEPVHSRVRVALFIMSQCPLASQVVAAIAPVLDEFGDTIEFRIDYIGEIAGDTLNSAHGENEVNGDKIGLCLQKYVPAGHKFMEVLSCMNENRSEIPHNWEECAKRLALPVQVTESLGQCYRGKEGKSLLRASFETSTARGVRGSPTILIDGEQYLGGRTRKDFVRFVCQRLETGKQPAICEKVVSPNELTAIIVADKRCTGKYCDTSGMVKSFEAVFPGVNFKTVDYGDPGGRTLYDDEGLKYLPVILFSPRIKEEDGFSKQERLLKPSLSGKWLLFTGRASFDPGIEICDNEADDTGNGLVDCGDPTCRHTLSCRPATPGQVELFIMSQCPIAVKAMGAMKEVTSTFGSDISFKVHFIGEESDGKLASMHGQAEVDEDIRQLCALEKYPLGTALKYAWCRNQELNSPDWPACTGDITGVDRDELESCFNGEGKSLLARDFNVGRQLDISASPSWIVNGRHRFSGFDAKTITRNICEHNPTLSACP